MAALRASNYVYAPGGGHSVSVVGYYDDATCPTGGYWVIKNSWGTGEGENGYDYMPYGSSVEANHCQNTLGAVYYTGAMATVTWKGTTNSTWDTTYNNRRNFANGSCQLPVGEPGNPGQFHHRGGDKP